MVTAALLVCSLVPVLLTVPRRVSTMDIDLMQYITDAQLRLSTGWGVSGHESWILLNDHPGPFLPWVRTFAVGVVSQFDPGLAGSAVVASMALLALVCYGAGMWSLGFGFSHWRGALLGAVAVNAVVALSFSFADSSALIDHWSLVSGGWAVSSANAVMFVAVCLAVASTVRRPVAAASLPVSAVALHVYLPYVLVAGVCLAVASWGVLGLWRSGSRRLAGVSVALTGLVLAPLLTRAIQEGPLFWLPRRFPVLEQEQPWTLHLASHLMLPPGVAVAAYAVVVLTCVWGAVFLGVRRRALFLALAALVLVTGVSQAVASGGGLVYQFAWVEAGVVAALCMFVGWLLQGVPLRVFMAGAAAASVVLSLVSLQRADWGVLTTSGTSDEVFAGYEAAWRVIDSYGGAVDIEGAAQPGATLLFYFPGVCVTPAGFSAYAFPERLCPPSRPASLVVKRVDDEPPVGQLREIVVFGAEEDPYVLWEVDPSQRQGTR